MAGEPGRSRAAAAAETVWAIRDRYADAFPLPPDRIAAILEDLGDRLGAIYQAEVDALDMTARAIGADEVVEMGESRTPRPEPFAWDQLRACPMIFVSRSGAHRQAAVRPICVSLDRASLRTT